MASRLFSHVRRLGVIDFLVLASAESPPARATWMVHGAPVCVDPGSQYGPTLAGDGAGGEQLRRDRTLPRLQRRWRRDPGLGQQQQRRRQHQRPESRRHRGAAMGGERHPDREGALSAIRARHGARRWRGPSSCGRTAGSDRAGRSMPSGSIRTGRCCGLPVGFDSALTVMTQVRDALQPEAVRRSSPGMTRATTMPMFAFRGSNVLNCRKGSRTSTRRPS